MTGDPQNLIFGKYELIRRLALGGMGEVFLARQTGSVSGTERLVILKSLLPELAEQDGFVDQFLDEARVAAKLNHPNVVQMFEAGLWNGVYFIAMEYIRGDNLSRIQKTAKAKGIALPVHIVVRIIRDALNGIDHAHTAIDDQTGQPLDVVHRDVSPQNIMVRSDGVTKVVDFGIAKAGNRSSRTATGVLKGKLQFMSPEQVKGEAVDARADQFAMGVVIWELLTGKRLFAGDNEVQILTSVLKQRIPKPSEVTPGLPSDLEAVIMKMLEREPAARFDSCAAAADELSAWLAQGSRRVSEVDVASFIKPIVGDNIDEQTRNLSSSENFLLQLHHTPTGSSSADSLGTSPTLMRKAQSKQRKMTGVSIGAGVVAALALTLGMAVVVSTEDRSPSAAIASPPSPPPPSPPPPPPPPPPEVLPAPPKKLRVNGALLEIELADPVGAGIIVDGQPWAERVPTTLRLRMGPHKVAIVDATGREHPVPLQLGAPVVQIDSEPPGASIIVAGSSFGITPARLTKLNGGATHELTLKKDGYSLKKILIENLQDGEERSLVVVLDKVATHRPSTPPPAASPPVAEPGAGTLVVNTTPCSSKVFLDGDFVGTTPFYLAKLPSGQHTVVLESVDTGQRRTKVIVIAPGEKKKLAETWN